VYSELLAYGFRIRAEGTAIRKSYRRCLAGNQQFLHEFYAALLPTLPEKIRSHFGNLDRQQTMLQMAFDIIIDLDTKEDLFRKLIAHGPHQQYTAALFDQFLEILLQEVFKNDREMTDALRLDWKHLKARAMGIVQQIAPKEF
jgi:hypothetical protein